MLSQVVKKYFGYRGFCWVGRQLLTNKILFFACHGERRKDSKFMNLLLLIIAPDKGGYQEIFFSYFSTKTCGGYSLAVPWQGASNEYPKYMFFWTNKKKYQHID